jgi:hypothetical protein
VTRVRFREDVGWEMRCDDCKALGRGACYWPLLPVGEFWSARTQIRCQACERERIRRARRRYDAKRPRDRRTAAAKARDYYYANRAAILARHRAHYAATRAVA